MIRNEIGYVSPYESQCRGSDCGYADRSLNLRNRSWLPGGNVTAGWPGVPGFKLRYRS